MRLMNRPLLLLTLVLLGTPPLLPQTTSKKGSAHIKVATIPPRPEDVSSVDGMIKAYYEVISGPAGQPRDWARDRTLYIPELRFVTSRRDKAGKAAMTVKDHQGYVDGADGMTTTGFFEKEIHRLTRKFGAITHVWSTYESRLKADGPVTARGINSIELFNDGTRYWITFAQWDDETSLSPIPQDYLP